MTNHPDGMTNDAQAVGAGPIRIGPILLGLVFFLGTVTVVPFLWALVVPLDVSSWALWVCLAAAIAGACLIGASGQPSCRRARAATWVGLIVSVLVLSVSGGCAALDAFMGDFSQTTTEARVASPNGRLQAVQTNVNEGALGESTSVIVRGRFIPGLLSWRYEVPFPGYGSPESLSWSNDRTVVVDGKPYRIPEPIVVLAQ